MSPRSWLSFPSFESDSGVGWLGSTALVTVSCQLVVWLLLLITSESQCPEPQHDLRATPHTCLHRKTCTSKSCCFTSLCHPECLNQLCFIDHQFLFSILSPPPSHAASKGPGQTLRPFCRQPGEWVSLAGWQAAAWVVENNELGRRGVAAQLTTTAFDGGLIVT